MRSSRLPKRRVPGWLKALDSVQLHAIAGRLLRESQQCDLTRGQEWLWDSVIIELGWRRAHALREGRVLSACVCDFCYGPFDEAD